MEVMDNMNKRIEQLRNKSVSTNPSLSINRAKIVTETYKRYSGEVSMPVLRALTFKNILENYPLYIGQGELIVGEKGIREQNAPTYPELCCHTVNDMETISKRDTIFFDVKDEDIHIQKEEIIPYWKGKSVREKILGNMTEKWKEAYSCGIFTEFMEQRAPGHTVGDDKFYKEGFMDFKDRINSTLDTIDKTDKDKIEQLKAMKISCQAISDFGSRYSLYSKELAKKEKNEKRKAELLQIAENCAQVPAHRPKTFYQAVQMYWFVHLGVTLEVNTWDSFSPGKLDQYLYPFYTKDIGKGILTREQAKEILSCLWIKFNNQPAPPKVGITLKESGTYTDFANINSGGINPYTGDDGVNDVSYIILEVMKELRLTQPSSNVQISNKTSDDFLMKTCEVIKDGWGQPAIYNTEMIIKELQNAGKTKEDALFGGASGCVETGAHGREAYILTGYLNVPKIFELALYDGYDNMSGKQLGPHTGDAATFKSYDEVFDAFKKQLRYFVDIKIDGNNKIEKIVAENVPVPFMSVITDDCIKKGVDYNSGGARYNTRYIQCVGIGTITDSLSAVKYGVFEDTIFTIKELLDGLNSNFSENGELHAWVKNSAPKYGNDEKCADEIMVEVFNLLYDEITDRPTIYGGRYRIDMLPTTCHIYFGSVTGALPNGRLSQKPLSEGISPGKGSDRKGPTAVIKSCAKMNHSLTGGTLLNQKFAPGLLKDQAGLNGMAALIKTYFALGGHHIQFNVIDKKTLRLAQKNPDEYQDLIVRVAGYSDYFNNLSVELQNEIINRTEHGAL